ncbi:MAG: hypothetical protein EKK46_04520 [Rhodocyclaceae bacterium]|nr:MAG: hypothetical protein EKK46_04520 [Rhodocyclaceae bacterium]
MQNAKEAQGPELARQATALAVVMAVTVGEVFLNLWFRVRVEEKAVPGHRDSLLKDLNVRIPLHHKLKHWPSRYLSAPLDLNSGAGGEFVKLKSLRNSIVHFTSSHESIELAGVTIHGLADTSAYDSLSSKQAVWALQTAENFVAEIFRLADIAEKEIPNALHAWAGKPPAV